MSHRLPHSRLPQRAAQGRCPACGRPFRRLDRRVRVAGVVFHRSCAVFEPR